MKKTAAKSSKSKKKTATSRKTTKKTSRSSTRSLAMKTRGSAKRKATNKTKAKSRLKSKTTVTKLKSQPVNVDLQQVLGSKNDPFQGSEDAKDFFNNQEKHEWTSSNQHDYEQRHQDMRPTKGNRSHVGRHTQHRGN